MTEIDDRTVDIPEPERVVPEAAPDTSSVDPGSDLPVIPSNVLPLGEDPAYDPGGMGRQPDVADDEDSYP